eukprot:6373911-Amphidinium_carterae.1
MADAMNDEYMRPNTGSPNPHYHFGRQSAGKVFHRNKLRECRELLGLLPLVCIDAGSLYTCSCLQVLGSKSNLLTVGSEPYSRNMCDFEADYSDDEKPEQPQPQQQKQQWDPPAPTEGRQSLYPKKAERPPPKCTPQPPRDRSLKQSRRRKVSLSRNGPANRGRRGRSRPTSKPRSLSPR